MATTTTICDSFKDELLQGIHDLDTDTIKCALYYSAATLTQATTAYSATNEASGTGYSAGGVTLTSPTVTLAANNSHVAAADWANAVFSNVTLSGIYYALLYNSSKANRAIAYCTYDAPGKSATAADFTVTLPESGTGVIRIS